MSEARVRETRTPADGSLRALADAISAGAMLAYGEHIGWASERLAEIAGFASATQLAELRVSELFLDTGDGLPAAAARAQVDCDLQRSDGSRCAVRCRVVDGIELCDGAVAWLIDDVSRLRSLESENGSLGRQLHAANRELADLRDRLRRESEEREELLTIVSHELRTPVTIISGYNRLLLAEKIGALNDEQRGFLIEGSKACRRLDLFIGNLLEASRQHSDGEVLEISHAPLMPVVDEVIGLIRPLIDDAKLDVRVDIAADADRARFDRTRLEQILINLLCNAIKFSPTDGTIEIATRVITDTHERAFVEFRISDEGPGVAPAYRRRIFEPYVQIGEECGAGGLGLGLAICRRLVEAHGGVICAEGRPGGGSAFVFTIPRSNGLGEKRDGGAR